jgi:hypothetical protein
MTDDAKLVDIRDGQAVFSDGSTLAIPKGVDATFREQETIDDEWTMPDRWRLRHTEDGPHSIRGLFVCRGTSRVEMMKCIRFMERYVAKRRQRV